MGAGIWTMMLLFFYKCKYGNKRFWHLIFTCLYWNIFLVKVLCKFEFIICSPSFWFLSSISFSVFVLLRNMLYNVCWACLKQTDVAADAGCVGTNQMRFKNEMLEWNEMLETKNKQRGGGHKRQNNPCEKLKLCKCTYMYRQFSKMFWCRYKPVYII